MTYEPRQSPGVQWQQTVIMRNGQSQEEAFSIGPDGCVWSFITESSVDAGGQRMENLGLEADFLTVGRNVAGALVVIAAKGLRTQYRTEIPLGALDSAKNPGHRWSPAQPIHLPAIQGATGVRRLYNQSNFSGMRIAIIIGIEQPSAGNSYVLACSQWHDSGPGAFTLLPSVTATAPGQDSKRTNHSNPQVLRLAH
jgi:hypothetical protein